MMTSVTVATIVLLTTAIRCFALNYICDEKYSKITPEHTMCKDENEQCNFLSFGTEMFETTYLRAHNSIRNSIRSNVGKKYHLATNMEIMKWDEELHEMALSHSLQCVEEPDCDLCHQIGDFPVEQNFAVKTYRLSETPDSRPVKRFKEVIKEWAAELRLYDPDVVKNFTFQEGLPTNWTNILRATTTHVGCASMNFLTDDPDIFKEVYVCYYGPANLTEGEEIYKAGEVPCSECKGLEWCDNKYSRLCAPSEEDARYKAVDRIFLPREVHARIMLGEKELAEMSPRAVERIAETWPNEKSVVHTRNKIYRSLQNANGEEKGQLLLLLRKALSATRALHRKR